MRFASSSRNDQLEAPLIRSTSYEGRFHALDDRLRTPAEHWLTLPGQVVPQQAYGVHPVLACQKPERCKPPERTGAEQIPTMVTEALLSQQPPGGGTGDHSSHEQPGA